jgi:hypothetical protein
MSRKELVAFLKAVLEALMQAEQPPPPTPFPPTPPPRAGHQAHLVPSRFGADWCCPAHEETAFMASIPATETLLDRLDHGARRYIRERLGPSRGSGSRR